MITNMNQMPPANYPIGFGRQHAEVMQQQDPSYTTQPYYPLGFNQQQAEVFGKSPSLYNNDDLQRQNELILERRRLREQEERQAEQIAFGNIETNRSPRKVSYEPQVQTYEPDEKVCTTI